MPFDRLPGSPRKRTDRDESIVAGQGPGTFQDADNTAPGGRDHHHDPAIHHTSPTHVLNGLVDPCVSLFGDRLFGRCRTLCPLDPPTRSPTPRRKTLLARHPIPASRNTQLHRNPLYTATTAHAAGTASLLACLLPTKLSLAARTTQRPGPHPRTTNTSRTHTPLATHPPTGISELSPPPSEKTPPCTPGEIPGFCIPSHARQALLKPCRNLDA